MTANTFLRFFRFALDCSTLSVGETLQFSIWCAERGASLVVESQDENQVNRSLRRVILHEDDNVRQFYRVRCTQRFAGNPWAARAARELGNYAPTVRFNRNY